jgi:exodeoxyribonuclease-3
VVCLQELKAVPDQVPITIYTMDGYWCYWHGGKAYSGVALLVAKSFAPELPVFTHPTFDFEYRIASVDLSTPFGPLTVSSVYVPNGGKDFPAKMQFVEAMDAHVDAAGKAGKALVLCGDMNIARTERDVHPKERKPRAIGQLPEERALMERLLSRGLVDVGRALDPDNDNLFSWWPPWRSMRERNIGWRLDYLFASEALASRATACVVQKEIGTSDHAPVMAMFE